MTTTTDDWPTEAREAFDRALMLAETSRRRVNDRVAQLQRRVLNEIHSPIQRDRWESLLRMEHRDPARFDRTVAALTDSRARDDAVVKLGIADNRWYIDRAVMHGIELQVEQNDRIIGALDQIVRLIRFGDAGEGDHT